MDTARIDTARIDTARIAALLQPFLGPSLSPLQYNQISMYIDLLMRWNARINLTAIRNQEDIVTRHFGESLFLARHLFPARSREPKISSSEIRLDARCSVLDIGSGAGFPALPLKIWAPAIHLTLVESNHKKVAFLREVARALTLMNINVIPDRIETLTSQSDFPRTQVVTLRAVERFEAILPHAATLVAPKGILALLIGEAQTRHLSPLTGFTWQDPIPLPNSQNRVLSIGVHA